MLETPKPIPLAFWRSATGREPVREWLKELSREDKGTIGRDIAKVQFGWPIGLPLCRPLSGGLWEVRSSLTTRREASGVLRLSRRNADRLARNYQESAKGNCGRPDARPAEIEGDAIMARKNPHIGSSFESWLDEEGIRGDVSAAAIKAVIARQLSDEMKEKKITKRRMAELMKTSRAQVDRLLDPDNGSATIESLQRAARIVGRELRMQLV